MNKKIMMYFSIFAILSFIIGASIPVNAASINAMNGNSSSITTISTTTLNYGWISGEVSGIDLASTSSIASTPLEDAIVCAYDPISQTVVACTKTDVYGQYIFSVEVGTYSVYADKEGYYRTTHANIDVTAGDVTEIDLTLQKTQEEESGWIYGEVYTTSTSTDSFYKILLQGVRICITSISDSYYSTDESCASSDSSGDYKIYAGEGSYKVTASKSGYYPSSKYLSVEGGEGTELNFNLIKKTESPSTSEQGSIYGRVLGVDIESDADSAAVPLTSASVSIRKVGGQVIQSSSGDSSIKMYRITSEDRKLVVVESNSGGMVDVKATAEPLEALEESAASEPITISASFNFWQTTLTDENGEYKFTSVDPQEAYEIKVAKYGYETSTKTITLEDVAEVNFVLTKRSDIIIKSSDPVKITVINESLIPLREMSGEQNIQKIDTAISEGFVGGELIIEKSLGSDIVLYDELLSINTLNIDPGSISLVISGDDNLPGKTIVINAENGVFDENGDIMLTYDGETISIADDFTDILNPNDDNYHAEYLIVEGSNGMQILVSIPHFSSHTINIYSVVEALGGIAAVIFYISTCILVSVLFAVTIFVRKRI